jgi:2-haloacid dehalogenase
VPAPILLFDVNETLLDMSVLNPMFRTVFGQVTARREWFLTLQSLWLTASVVGEYQPFDRLARAALRMTAGREHVELRRADEDAILNAMKELPPHPDVPAALEELRTAGVRLAVLSNGTMAGIRAQLRHARLDAYFEALFSADDVQRYKPTPEPYHHAAKGLRAARGRVDLVSVHAWDIAGARHAGLFTIFVARPGHPPNPVHKRADITVADVGELARRIAARRSVRRSR